MLSVSSSTSAHWRAVKLALVVILLVVGASQAAAQADSSSTAISDSVLHVEPVSSQPPAAVHGEAMAPTHIPPAARLYVPSDEFGMALCAAILKKHVPIVAMTDSLKSDFFVRTVSHSTKEGGAERIAKILVFGGWAGSGKQFNATVTITNRDGAVVFGHNSKKENFQSAAENVAKRLKQSIEGN